MFYVLKTKKLILIGVLLLVCLGIILTSIRTQTVVANTALPVDNSELQTFLNDFFVIRNEAIKKGDIETVKKFYNINKKAGLYAFDHEEKKLKYLKNWSEKQGVTFTDIVSKIGVKWSRSNGPKLTINFLASTAYTYVYTNQPETKNLLRIGTYHEIVIDQNEGGWLIAREWYTDPFADSLDLENLKTEDNKAFILSGEARDFSDMNQRRSDAATYADLYCGAAASGENGYSYNKKYKDYNSIGGNCANFASQILYEGGKFKKNGTWNYDKDGSMAWVSARGLKSYLLNSGRGSLIASGSYDKVLKLSYKLLPGDIVAYEKKGKVTHVSVVTGADSKGYSLVNCHNTDRYRVPWDLGWSNSKIKFYLIRVNY